MIKRGEFTMPRTDIAPIPVTTEVINGFTVSVSDNPLGVGNGKAHAEISSREEALELSRAVMEKLGEISPDASTGCGDGRNVIEIQSSDNRKELGINPKLFGGSVNAALGAALLEGKKSINPSEKESYKSLYNRMAEDLTSAGRRLGAHVDNHHDGEHSNCGSLDKAQAVYAAAGNAENAAALKPLVQYFTEKLGVQFSDEHYERHVANAKATAESNLFDTWSGMEGINTTKAKDGIVRVLDGGEHGDPAHNHRENLIVAILKEGIGLDKEALIAETGKQVFVLTLPQLRKKAEIIASETTPEKMEQSVNALIQAGVLFQLAHALVVPDGSQYLMIVE